jgi:ligand-binding sensor domain-containing protein
LINKKLNFMKKLFTTAYAITLAMGAFAQNCLSYKTDNSDIPNNVTWGIYIDNLDQKWVSSTGGVSLFDNIDWTSYNSSTSNFPSNFIREVTTTSNGDIWAGSVMSGVYRLSGNTWVFYNTSNSSIPSDVIYDIFTDNNDQVWIATDNGTAKFNGTNWQIYNTSNVSGFPSLTVKDIEQNSAGKIFFSSEPQANWTGGLGVFDNGSMTAVYRTASYNIASNTVSSSVEDISGALIIGTNNGLCYFSNNQWITFNTSNSTLPSNTITDVEIFNGDTSRIWISTNAGITSYNTVDKIWETAITTSNSCIPTNNINDLEIDQYGNVWFTRTQGGLMAYNRNTLAGPITTGIEKSNKGLSKVYPNPTSDNFYIDADLNSDIELSNLSGNVLKRYSAEQNSSYSTNDLEAGTYLLSYLKDGNRISTKLVIKK